MPAGYRRMTDSISPAARGTLVVMIGTGVDSLGFVGFGEAAFHLAKGLRDAGVKRTVAFDIHMHTAGLGEKIQDRARETGTALVEFSAALPAAAQVIISAVTAD